MSLKDYLNQNYSQLKLKNLSANTLFVDETFPANDRSISLIKTHNKLTEEREYDIYWKRPFEIVPNPKFIVNGIDPNDLHQGSTGNCWFISAAASIATLPHYRDFVIPSNQSFEKSDYAGIFHFRFWQFGQWLDVVVDDYLPVDEDNQLIYCHNLKEENEFWGPLMEKAYAKLASCYEFLDAGQPMNAFTDMTGGIGESIDIRKLFGNDEESDGDDEDDDDEYEDVDDEDDEDDWNDEEEEEADVEKDFDRNGHVQNINVLWRYMIRSYKMQSLLNASFQGEDDEECEEEDDDDGGCLANGLVSAHAYSLYQVVEVKFGKGDRVRLIKLRNPHGTQKSWKGAYSPKNKKWKNMSPALKKKYNLSLEPNGEFYMTFEDFIDNFDEVSIFHVNMNAFLSINSTIPTVVTTQAAKKNGEDESAQWRAIQIYDEWRSGLNAGDAENPYWNNTQFLIEVSTPKYSRDETMHTSVIIGLMQPYSAQLRYENNGEDAFLPIKFDLYMIVCDQNKIREYKQGRRKFRKSDLKLIDSIGDYREDREVTKKCFLDTGFYVILPSTSNNRSTQYLLRLFYDMLHVTSAEKLTN